MSKILGVHTVITSGTNYITNSTAKIDTSGWAPFADGATLTDGTGGVPTAALTRNTLSPLRDGADFLYTKGALGDGVSYDFTVDEADKSKVLSISFDWKAAGNVAEGDYEIWIYRKDATAKLIQPAGYKLAAGIAGTQYKHIATFQTDSDASNYRLIIYQTTASTNNIQFDAVSVGPQTVQYGAPVTDWVSYTPTVGGSTANGTVTYTTQVGWYRRIGDSVEVNGRININTVTSAPTGELSVSLPSGITIDTSKTINSSSVHASVFVDSSASVDIPVVATYSSNVGSSALRLRAISSTAIPTLAASDAIYFNAVLPVTGWSSTVQMSNDTDTRVVAAYAHRNGSNQSSGLTPNNSSVQVVFNSTAASGGVGYDTHGAYNSAGYYLVPVSGKYRFNAQLDMVSTNVLASQYQLSIRTGTSSTFSSGTDVVWGKAEKPAVTTAFYLNLNATLDLTAGTYVFLGLWGAGNNSATSLSMYGDATLSYWNIERLSGPSAIAASETVAATYQTDASTGQSLTSTATVKFQNKVFDTHGSYSTSTGQFTAPVSGKYRVSYQVVSNDTSGTAAVLAIRKGTTVYARNVARPRLSSASTLVANHAEWGSTMTIDAVAGDTLDIYVTIAAGAGTVYKGSPDNYLSIERIGN